jgi:TRAP transporter TAXI family solute receptor
MIPRTAIKQALTACAAVVALALPAAAQDTKLPDRMMWSAYDVGSSGYAQAAAISDALTTAYGTRIRIMPSGTSIGRMLPLKTGRVTYGWLANEVFFATEAIHDFASREWGPQNLRVLMGKPSSYGIAVAADAGIESIEDLRGKRIARVAANPSLNIKNEAILAFAGLTWDDVEVVDVPGYAQSIRAVIEGRADAAGGVPGSALFRELEASNRGIAWVDIPADNDAGWQKLRDIASFFAPVDETVGAGLSPENPAALISYRYPMITVYADADEEEIYNLTKAMIENFDAYKDATSAMPRWTVGEAGVPPADAPFHPGAVRALQEAGVWTDDHTAWNEARLARLEAVIAAWDTATEEAFDQDVSDKDWPAFWAERRAALLD